MPIPLSQVDEAFKLQQKLKELSLRKNQIITDPTLVIPEWRIQLDSGGPAAELTALNSIKSALITMIDARISNIESQLVALDVDLNT